MTKRSALGLKTLICKNECTLLKTLKSGAPSAKMTKRGGFGLKTSVFVQTRALCLKPLKSGVPRTKMTKMGVLSEKMPKCANLGLKTSVLYKLVHFALNL